MIKEFIMQMRPWFDETEKEALVDLMDNETFLTEFKHTEKFENAIKSYTGAKNCILVNNGTISLTIAAYALGIGNNDDVIVPNYTMVATPNSVKFLGANPIFVDVERETLCIDLEDLKSKVTNKTKAIMLVSANGRYPLYDIKKLQKFCLERNIYIIEDSAQSLGSFYPDGTHIGLKGDIGSFSFSMPKIITTGQGGALITNNDDLAAKIRKIKDFGRSGGGNDVHDSIGFNFKFTEMQAVIGISQMKKLDFRVKRKKEIYKRYQENLHNVSSISFFNHDFSKTAPWFIDCIAEDRSNLQQHLKENNIGSRVMYPPINRQKAYSIEGNFPISYRIGDSGLWLPSMAQLSDGEIDYITDKIRDFYERS